jgi:hypothetical protein
MAVIAHSVQDNKPAFTEGLDEWIGNKYDLNRNGRRF